MVAREATGFLRGRNVEGAGKSYEMMLRYAHLAPEKLISVAGCIERQALTIAGNAARGEKRSKKCYVGATVGVLSPRNKPLINFGAPGEIRSPGVPCNSTT